MTRSGCIHALAHDLPEVDFRPIPANLLIASAASTQNLLNRLREPVRVAQHDTIELLPLRLGQFAPLQSFKMKADRCYWSLQFVGDRIDEAVMLLVAPDLPHQEDGVHDHAGDDEREKDQAEEQQNTFAPVENDPSDIEGNRQRHQANAQAEKEDDGSASARDAHGSSSMPILARSALLASEHRSWR